MDWQPIETAPKNGTAVLLWDGEARCCGRWINDYGWSMVALVNERSLHANEPTHWMPLPEPPK